MLLFVAGFPTKVAGLKFEYMWTYPCQSRYVDAMRVDIRNPLVVNSAMQVLTQLLTHQPYQHQPLTLHFVDYPFYCSVSETLK